MIAVATMATTTIRIFKLMMVTTTTLGLLIQGQRNFLLVVNQNIYLLTRLEIFLPVKILSGQTVPTDLADLLHLKDLSNLTDQTKIKPRKITSTIRITMTLRQFPE